MSEIIDKMKKDMFAAIKEHDHEISGIVQLSLASVKNTEIEKGEPLTEEEIIQVLRKESKKLQDSIEQFQNAGADELLQTSERQKQYISQYLPQLMTPEEVEVFVEKKMVEIEATSMRDMGKLMGAVMSELTGKADGDTVKEVVMRKLQQ